MNLNNAKRIIKGNLIVRYLAWPYMAAKKQRNYKEYLASPDTEKVKELKGKYKGKRCFIVGNGPSLRVEDLEKLTDELTFGSNRIYNIFSKTHWRPSYYVAEDEDAYAEMLPIALGYKLDNYILSPNAEKYENAKDLNIYHVYWYNHNYVANRYDDKSIHISEDISNHVSIGYTVTFSSIQMAIYMGIKEIYLLGVDFDYAVSTNRIGLKKRMDGAKTYFDGKERKGSYLNYHSTRRAYQTAKEYCEHNGIIIRNTTRGGKLDIFERTTFDDLFQV